MKSSPESGQDEEHIDAGDPHRHHIRKRLLQRAHLLIGETAVGHIDTANARQSGERFGYLRAGVLDMPRESISSSSQRTVTP